MKKNSGISAVPLIFALVLMITLGAFFISLMLGKHIGAPLLAQSTKALFIADAGIEFAAIYLRGFANDPDWTNGITNIASTSFGDGTFAVTFTNNTQDSVTAASVGTFGNARRDIFVKFTRLAVLMPNPVDWLNKIQIKNGVTVNGPPTCTPCQDLVCLGNPCATRVTLAQAPPPIPPTGFTWWDGANPPITNISGYNPNDGRLQITGNSNFSEGTYFFDRLEIGSSAIVTITGHVTIWIQDKFKMNDTSQFNWGGDAANLLLLSAGGLEDAEPDFEIKGGAWFRGAIYGPQAEVEIKDAHIAGAIVGNEVKLENTTITSDPTAGLNAMINASNWGEI